MLVAKFRKILNLRLMIGCCVVLTELLTVSAPAMSQTWLEDRVAAAAGAAAARASSQSKQEKIMAKTWFVTGASRGFGALIVAEALTRGDNVVATARTPEAVTSTIVS